jgi:hypothetical protein
MVSSGENGLREGFRKKILKTLKEGNNYFMSLLKSLSLSPL